MPQSRCPWPAAGRPGVPDSPLAAGPGHAGVAAVPIPGPGPDTAFGAAGESGPGTQRLLLAALALARTVTVTVPELGIPGRRPGQVQASLSEPRLRQIFLK